MKIEKENAIILYKVLDKDRSSPYHNFKYRKNKIYHCDNFDTDKSVSCSYGFYATDLEGLPYAYNTNKKVFKCRVWGETVECDQYKRRYEYFQLLDKVSQDELFKLCKRLDKKLGYNLSMVIKPINPLLLPCKKLTSKHKKLLKVWASVGDSVWASVWASVRDSVGASVGDSVRDSVGASVRASVGDSVWASVRDSVGASVWAYMSSMFPNMEIWKYIKHKKEVNPFQPCIDLWNDGFVPSYDGKVWRLHRGKKAKIVYEFTKKI